LAPSRLAPEGNVAVRYRIFNVTFHRCPHDGKTGFDKFFEAHMKNRDFAAGYEQTKREIDTVDRIVRALDEARVEVGMSKAELARRISTTPELVRRLLT
jgi:ribosome-binding protein aMBF1 (putative translation factor)